MLLYLTDLRKGDPYTRLARYTYGGDPREFTYMTRAFTNHLYETFYHKISGNSMEYWIPYINEFRRAIWRRLVSGNVTTTEYDEFEAEERETTRHYVDVPFENFRIFGFLDASGYEGPRPGDEATRFEGIDEDIQRVFYR